MPSEAADRSVRGLPGPFVVSVSLATVFWPGIFIGLGIVGLAAVVGCIGLVRSYQSDNARKEYEQTRPLTPQ